MAKKKSITADNMKKRNKTKTELAIIFLISLIIFSLPSILRWTYFDRPGIIGFPTYMHERQAIETLEGQSYDQLSFGGRDYTYPPLLRYVLAFLFIPFSIEPAGVILISLFGALSVVFFYLIVREHITEKYALLSSILFLILPGTIYFNSHLSSRAPPFALGLAALYFIIKNVNKENNPSKGRKKNLLIAGFLLGISALFHLEPAIIFGMISLFYAAKDRKVFLSLLIAAAIASVYYIPFFASYGFPEINALHEDYRSRGYSLETPGLYNFLFELRFDAYLIIPIAGLAVLGFLKRRHFFLYYWTAIVLLASIAAERFLIYLTIPIMLLAIYGVLHLEKKKYFKMLLIIILIYSIIAASAKIIYFANSFPTQEQYKAMQWIGNNTPPNTTILSDWQWGHWISGISGRKTFVDGYAEYAPNATDRIHELEEFYSTCKIPDGNNISYVYMEKWFVDLYDIKCLNGNFDLVYNNSELFVYKI